MQTVTAARTARRRAAYADDVNAAVEAMTFGQKREALSDWDWWFRKQMHQGRRAADFRDWLAERIEERLQAEADRRNADMALDVAAYGCGYRIARPGQLRGWTA